MKKKIDSNIVHMKMYRAPTQASEFCVDREWARVREIKKSFVSWIGCGLRVNGLRFKRQNAILWFAFVWRWHFFFGIVNLWIMKQKSRLLGTLTMFRIIWCITIKWIINLTKHKNKTIEHSFVFGINSPPIPPNV